jgi:hypothetical protein
MLVDLDFINLAPNFIQALQILVFCLAHIVLAVCEETSECSK